jgi:hypothetical protein
MIYTVTLNPSLDYIVEVDQVSLGELNRTKKRNQISRWKRNQCFSSFKKIRR